MELHIAFDQANHFSAIVIPKEESGSTFWTGKKEFRLEVTALD